MVSRLPREHRVRGVVSMLIARGVVRGSGLPDRPRVLSARRSDGFTLVEMLLVMAVIALMATIALPQLMPSILLSRLDGAARHVAGYGRAAMAQATLMRETIIVKLDLTNQEYWAVRRVEKAASIFDEDPKGKKSKTATDKKKKRRDTSRKQTGGNDGRNDDFLNLLGYGRSEKDGATSDEGAMTEADMMRKQFDRFVQTQMLARSKQVKRGGILDEIGPLFDKKFSLEDEKETEEEVTDPLLSRTSLPDGVVIESVHVGGASHTKGEVAIEITALGLSDQVTFYLKGEDESYYTVVWDPITGNVHIEKGKKDVT